MPITGDVRRSEIVNLLKTNGQPLSGRYLAEHFQVSRQVIVQDIALLRAMNFNVMSTNRGYILENPSHVTRVFCVNHTDEEMEKELNLIVDQGASVLDVFVEHAVYGEVRVRLDVCSRRDVKDFMDSIKNGKASPLKNLTSNSHYHTVEADSVDILDYVEKELRDNHFLTN